MPRVNKRLLTLLVELNVCANKVRQKEAEEENIKELAVKRLQISLPALKEDWIHLRQSLDHQDVDQHVLKQVSHIKHCRPEVLESVEGEL